MDQKINPDFTCIARNVLTLWVFFTTLLYSTHGDPDIAPEEGGTKNNDNENTQSSENDGEQDGYHVAATSYYVWTGVMLVMLLVATLTCILCNFLYNWINKRPHRQRNERESEEQSHIKQIILTPPSYVSAEPPSYTYATYQTVSEKNVNVDKRLKKKRRQRSNQSASRTPPIPWQHNSYVNPAVEMELSDPSTSSNEILRYSRPIRPSPVVSHQSHVRHSDFHQSESAVSNSSCHKIEMASNNYLEEIPQPPSYQQSIDINNQNDIYLRSEEGTSTTEANVCFNSSTNVDIVSESFDTQNVASGSGYCESTNL